ncbi:hypothetical protein [Paraburkholderia humisilvae]|uniref:Mobilization protein n=1 Tax=Paraburkholderia humisilvae TaxID=627669 RepID=A0A6J5FAC7_9BURK|nr:hypothetical protein [Paraburkholderia humisilvae]CAB3774387.1 hypothetical protein LMG29542_07770 [Paraburkholderia humisilvae]
MSLLKNRVKATDEKIKAMKDARKTADRERRQAYKQTRADRERRVMLVGETVLHRVERGEWDEAEFRKMMDEALTRPADRALFDLDE